MNPKDPLITEPSTHVYHPSKGDKIVHESVAKELYVRGWYDSPRYNRMAEHQRYG